MRLRFTLLTLATWLAPMVSEAQVLAVAEATPAPETPLSGRFGLEEGRTGLFAPDLEVRHRAIDRLVTLGTPEALGVLLESLEGGSPVARDPSSRLRLVRALAAFADRDEIRAHLGKEMLDVGGRRDSGVGLPQLVRETAAMALARRGDAPCVASLVSAAQLRGAAGEPARRALLAYPPSSASALLFEEAEVPVEEPPVVVAPAGPKPAPKPGDPKKPRDIDEPTCEGDCEPQGPALRSLNPAYVTFLGDLGDIRAIGALRPELDRSDRSMRGATALALAKLGDGLSIDAIRAWDEKSDARLLLAAAEALAAGGSPDARRFLALALASPDVRKGALTLANQLPSPELCRPLAALKDDLSTDERVRLTMAAGRSGCISQVVGELGDPVVGGAAITALATAASEEAEQALDGALAKQGDAKLDAATRPWLRAATLRAIATGEASSTLVAALERALASTDPVDVEIGAFGLVALGERSVAELLQGSSSDAAVFGVARAALALEPEELDALRTILVDVDPEAPSPRHLAAGIALLGGGDGVPLEKLFRLAERGGGLSSLAAAALGPRVALEDRARVLALLGGSDAAIRAGLAFGLGHAKIGAVTTWLAQAYDVEEDAMVRRAIVAGLALRTEKQRERTLELARTLDPSASVRAAARSGPRTLAELLGLAPGNVTFTRLSSPEGRTTSIGVSVQLPGGVALPMVSSADGSLAMTGLPHGPTTVRLAAPVRSLDAP
jgi:cellulose synthase operon protein C